MKFKKPKFWDLNKPNFLSKILIIFTIPIIINNFLLSFKKKQKNSKIKTICIGNIYVGGTGKTPLTMKIYNICKKLNFKAATAKKYYSDQLDERKILQKNTNLITAKNRKIIIKKAIKLKYDLLVFDDGLQDRNISYDLQCVCFDVDKWIGNGNLIPSGPLREKISSISKYDAVFLKNGTNKNIVDTLMGFNSSIKIFTTYYEVRNLKKINLKKKYLIFSGIGNPVDFKNILLNNGIHVADELIYPDHFNYQTKEIKKIKDYAKRIGAEIITTEKDFVKIKDDDNKNINFIEISLKVDDEENLINFIKSKLHDQN